MHDNVWEWCQDYWHENYQGAPTDGSAWLMGGNSNLRLLHGGSWYISPGRCRSAVRDFYSPDYYDSHIGFRVVLSA